METARRTLAALLVAVAVGGCDGGDRTAAPATPAPAAGAVGASPILPHVSTRLPLLVQPGLTVMTPDVCDPERHRVCSRDGQQTWAPLGDPHPVTLLEASTHLNEAHTSWTTVLRVDPASSADLARAARAAAGSGGFVLVTEPDHTVLAAAPPDQVSGPRIAFPGLDKPAAWRLVATFDLHDHPLAHGR